MASVTQHQLIIQLRPGDDVGFLTAQVDQLLAEHRNEMRLPNHDGWNQETMTRFLALLLAWSPMHVTLMHTAAQLGGSIPRLRVMSILGRPADAYLNGITRPVTGAMGELVKQGLLSDQAELPLRPSYDGPGPGKADRLVIPDDLVPMVLAAMGSST